MRHRLALFALALTACTSFDSVSRGVCGNGLIEPGEDCDSSAASCVRCAVTCSTAMDCPTADYSCGVDGLCYAPGGALGQPVPAGTFQVNDYVITDVDHDGTGDVLGSSRTSLVVRHGDPTGRLAQVDSLVTPAQTGPAAVGDLDGDGSRDLTITTADGMVAYSSPYGTLSPLAVQSTAVSDAAGMPIDFRMLIPIRNLIIGAFVADPNGRLFFAAVEFQGNTTTTDAPCLLRNGVTNASTFSPANVDVYAMSGPSDLDLDEIISFTTGGTPNKLCVLLVHKTFLQALTISDITPVNAIAPQKKPILVDLDADGDKCPSLVNSDGGPMALKLWDGNVVAGRCTLKVSTVQGDPLPPNSMAAPNVVAVGRIPVDPPVNGYAHDMLVMNDGLYALATGATPSFANIYRSTRRLSRAAFGDLDGNGQMDAVLVPESEDDLDLLLRTNVFLIFPSYQLLRIDTASRVTDVVLGDFDGNGIVDISYVEQLTDHQRLMVAYGTPDRPLTPIEVGAFAQSLSIAKLNFPDSSDLPGLADDLFMLLPALPSHAELTLTFFHGSPQRTMLPYFEPRAKSNVPTLLRGAIAGNFVAGGKGADLLTIAVDNRPNATVPQQPLGFRIPGTSAGPDATPTPGFPLTGVADCLDSGGSALCIQDVAYLPWAIAADQDVVIGVDRSATPHAARIAAAANGVATTVLDVLVSKIPASSVVHTLYRTDFDHDGKDDLIASFAPRHNATGKGGVLVCQMTDGAPQSCEDLMPAIVAAAPTVTACIDAAPARVDYRDPLSPVGLGTDLVVVCQDQGTTLLRVRHGATAVEVVILAHFDSAIGGIRVGDVTGDGLDDIVAIQGDSGAQSLVVFPQCSSRNVAACGGGQ